MLSGHHYLGVAERQSLTLGDARGVLVFVSPSSRHLPTDWLELARWCILPGQPNAGSQMWRDAARILRRNRLTTTVVSYSDPSAGHTGALYRACNWLWAPTWHRLMPPPSGNGDWGRVASLDEPAPSLFELVQAKPIRFAESVKDRWIYPVAADPRRVPALRIKYDRVLRRFPWAAYDEPAGVDFKSFAGAVAR
jgi:hypothetical protein